MVRSRRPLRGLLAANMALQRTRRPRIGSGRSLRSLGSPLNARSLDAGRQKEKRMFRRWSPLFLTLATLAMMLLGHRAAAAAPAVEFIAVDFSVEPIDAARTMFACRVEVFDL